MTTLEKTGWIKICTVHEVRARKRIVAWVNKTEIMIVHAGSHVRAFVSLCPHQGGPLGEGELTDATVGCPWHGCKFQLATGRCVSIGSCKNLTPDDLELLKKVEVRVENDNVCVDERLL